MHRVKVEVDEQCVGKICIVCSCRFDLLLPKCYSIIIFVEEAPGRLPEGPPEGSHEISSLNIEKIP